MFIATYFSDGEKIEIVKESNGKFYIHYGIVFIERYCGEVATCTAGYFNSFDEALTALKKHRSNVVEVKRGGTP